LARVSFDSGVLIALDRGEAPAWAWLERAARYGEPPLVSTAAIAEAWRDGRRQVHLASALRLCDIEAVDEPLARRAGEALASTGGDDPVDALVAATAARSGAMLVTGDLDDMQTLADRHFRALRVAPLAAQPSRRRGNESRKK
jgi:predicted nucleic acid-binding protein